MLREDFSVVYCGTIVQADLLKCLLEGVSRREAGKIMDKPRHPQVIRTWKVERIRKPASTPKGQPPRRKKGTTTK